jgi:hypothetical protein
VLVGFAPNFVRHSQNGFSQLEFSFRAPPLAGPVSSGLAKSGSARAVRVMASRHSRAVGRCAAPSVHLVQKPWVTSSRQEVSNSKPIRKTKVAS